MLAVFGVAKKPVAMLDCASINKVLVVSFVISSPIQFYKQKMYMRNEGDYIPATGFMKVATMFILQMFIRTKQDDENQARRLDYGFFRYRIKVTHPTGRVWTRVSSFYITGVIYDLF